MHQNLSRQRGITLLELMTVVVIVALLATLGYPSYAEYMQRAQRTEARGALLQYAAEQEKFYLTNNTYATSMAQLRGTGGATMFTESGNYEVSIVGADATGYTLQADFQGTNSEASRCDIYTINQNNERGSSPYPAAQCWDR
ncbi:MAG: type IV pilin protein [Pseudomonadota bacterium]